MTNSAPDKKANILIVDDTPANLRLLADLLSFEDYVVRPVKSGELAIKAAMAACPDLILLDIMMPKMNGFEVCEHLKKEASTRDVPIIFISALSEVKDKVKALNAGGVDYVNKPFQADEVLARVRTHLALSQMQIELSEQNEKLKIEIEERRRTEAEKENLIVELKQTLDEVKTLQDLIPICANCKKIRDDQGYWQGVEVYISDHTDAKFSHGICPECIEKLYPDYFKRKQMKNSSEGTPQEPIIKDSTS